MKIISLRAENVKRLSVVEITPSGSLVEVTGKNRAGKTSTLDSIFFALSGERGITSRPIRDGEERALIRLDMGDLIVTRRFTRRDDGDFSTTLRVENADGAQYAKPQNMLDALVSGLTFDPSAFLDAKPADQIDMIKGLVPGFDFTAADRADEEDTGKRRDLNRKVKDLEVQAAGIRLPYHVPAERADEDALVAALSRAGEQSRQIANQRAVRVREQSAIAALVEKARASYEEAEALRRRAEDLETETARIGEETSMRSKALAALPPLAEPVDTASLADQLKVARAANSVFAQAERRGALLEEAEQAAEKSRALTQAMADRKQARVEAVAKADLPVEGLGFGEGEVTLNGLPFSQASDAERLRTSVAIAAALSPKLRIARVRDGSKLDSDAMTALAEFAEAHDLQVWVETVEANRPSAIVIEDGRVKGAPALLAAE